MEKRASPARWSAFADDPDEHITEVSRKVREESMRVNEEFSAIEGDPEG